MIALFGSLLGLFGSFLPNFLKLWQDKKDKQHELEILKLQLKREEAGHTQRLEEIGAMADITETEALYKTLRPTGIHWVDALTSSVRPVITYAFFALYAYIKLPIILRGVEGGDYLRYYLQVWSEMDIAIFCTIITFWFGNRTFQKIFIKK